MVYVSGSAQCIFLCSHWSGDILLKVCLPRASIPIQSYTLQPLSVWVFLWFMQLALLPLMVKGIRILTGFCVPTPSCRPSGTSTLLAHIIVLILTANSEKQSLIPAKKFIWFIENACHSVTPMSDKHYNACQSNSGWFLCRIPALAEDARIANHRCSRHSLGPIGIKKILEVGYTKYDRQRHTLLSARGLFGSHVPSETISTDTSVTGWRYTVHSFGSEWLMSHAAGIMLMQPVFKVLENHGRTPAICLLPQHWPS